jgi:hypothetical protein
MVSNAVHGETLRRDTRRHWTTLDDTGRQQERASASSLAGSSSSSKQQVNGKGGDGKNKQSRLHMTARSM